MVNFEASEPVVILGFGQMGQVQLLLNNIILPELKMYRPKWMIFCSLCSCLQVLANLLATPLASGVDGDALGLPYVAFDLDLSVVKVNKNCVAY